MLSPLGSASWTWLDNRRLGAQTLPNLAWSEYTYLPNGRLSGLTNKDATGNVLSRYFALDYAGTGDLLSLAAEVPGETSLSGTTAYAYDAKRQLTRETSTRAGGSVVDAPVYGAAGLVAAGGEQLQFDPLGDVAVV